MPVSAAQIKLEGELDNFIENSWTVSFPPKVCVVYSILLLTIGWAISYYAQGPVAAFWCGAGFCCL